MSRIADFAAQVVAADLPDAQGLAAEMPALLLDCAGAWIAGSATEEARDLAPDPLGPLGDGWLDAIARAVATVRLTETDDIHLASCTTAGSVVVPSALILARALNEKIAPARVARAIAAGYDCMIRFAEAVRGPEILYRGLWPTYLAAPLGAAATAAVLLDLDADPTAHALALALVQISGAPGRGEKGRNPRWLLAGLAAGSGITAALAARRGFGGDLSLLDGDWLARTHGLEFDPQAMRAAAPGGALQEISRKRFCAARQTIAALEAFGRLLSDGVKVADVEAVTVFAPKVYAAMIAQPPSSRIGRIAGVAWLLALAALRPDDLYDLERPPLDDPRLAEFAARVRVEPDPALDALYPTLWPARVELRLRDGTQRIEAVDTAYGDPQRPLSEADRLTKFLRLAGPVVGAAEAGALADLCAEAAGSATALADLTNRLERLSA